MKRFTPEQLDSFFEERTQSLPAVPVPPPEPLPLPIDRLILQYVREQLAARQQQRQRHVGECSLLCQWDRPGNREIFVCRHSLRVHECCWGAYGVMKCSYRRDEDDRSVCGLTGTDMGPCDLRLEAGKEFHVSKLVFKAVPLAAADGTVVKREIKRADTALSVDPAARTDQANELYARAHSLLGKITRGLEATRREQAAWRCVKIWELVQTTAVFKEHNKRMTFVRLCCAIAHKHDVGHADGALLPQDPVVFASLIPRAELCNAVECGARVHWFTSARRDLREALNEIKLRKESLVV